MEKAELEQLPQVIIPDSTAKALIEWAELNNWREMIPQPVNPGRIMLDDGRWIMFERIDQVGRFYLLEGRRPDSRVLVEFEWDLKDNVMVSPVGVKRGRSEEDVENDVHEVLSIYRAAMVFIQAHEAIGGHVLVSDVLYAKYPHVTYTLNASGARLNILVSGKPLDPDQDLEAQVESEMANYYEKWLDESIPALSGKTPREAVRTAAGRRELELLFQYIRTQPSTMPFPEQKIRRQLGLTAQ